MKVEAKARPQLVIKKTLHRSSQSLCVYARVTRRPKCFLPPLAAEKKCVLLLSLYLLMVTKSW